jgi:hypothetical protein
MKVFKDLASLDEAPPEMTEEHHSIIHIDDVGQPFLDIFGGDWFLIENVEDIKNILPPPYDIVEWKKDYLMLVVINNNSGGPCYFVPRAIVEATHLKDLETTN